MKIRLPDGEIFDMPQWQDCAWQRVPCGKSKCKICGPAKKQRARHLAAGRDPDDPQSVMMDMTDNFQRTLDLLNKAAKRDGFDIEAAMKNFDKAQEAEKIPKAEDFPLYREVDGWGNSVNNVFVVPVGEDDSWWHSDAAQDVTYYSAMLGAKVYRQSATRAELEAEEEYLDADYLYTKYVLEYVIDKLRAGLGVIMNQVASKRVEVMVLLAALQDLEAKIKKLNNFYGRRKVGPILR